MEADIEAIEDMVGMVVVADKWFTQSQLSLKLVGFKLAAAHTRWEPRAPDSLGGCWCFWKPLLGSDQVCKNGLGNCFVELIFVLFSLPPQGVGERWCSFSCNWQGCRVSITSESEGQYLYLPNSVFLTEVLWDVFFQWIFLTYMWCLG